MKFLLHKGLGYSTVQQIGNRLRAQGSGHHWVEKYRGAIFVHVSDYRDEAILRNEFADILDPTANTEAGGPYRLSDATAEPLRR